MSKAPDAFRTISEVSSILDTPAHVLRFWESKFSQIKPIKRAGARRYYRPEDVALLAGIKKLLHEQGMTIKGAQKLLRENGIKHVQAIGAETVSDDVAVDAVVPVAASTKEQPSTPADVPEDTKPVEVEAEPKLEISNITAFRPRTDSTDDAPSLPSNPAPQGELPARYFGMAKRATPDAIRAKAAKIAPLLARLETVRDQMRRT